MKKINYKILFLILFIFILLGVSLVPKRQYIPYDEFYYMTNNNKIKTIFFDNSNKIKFKTNDNEIFYTDNPRKENFKEEILKKGISFKETLNKNNILILAIIIVTVYIIIFYKTKNKNKKQLFIKQYEKNENSIYFEDIIGEEAKDNAKDIVDFLKYPEKYKILNAKMPKGIIFYGMPGTGKTMLAKAIANEANVPFFSMCGSDFIEMYAGVGALRIRNLFKEARKYKNAVIFIDEIDAIGKKRSNNISSSNDEREQTLNALLTEMSGFSSDENIVVIATTNRIDILDDALIRAGRFDRHIEISLPDKISREKIIKILLKNKNVDSSVNIEEIAKKTVYFSGAMLNTLINEASILAVKENKKFINEKHINKAYTKILAGDEKKDTSFLSKQDKKITAIHESGHALITTFLKTATVSKISIIPTLKGAGGFCINIFEDKLFKSKKEIENEIMCLYAGRCAEELLLGKNNITSGAYNDIEKATKIIIDYVSKYGMVDNHILTYKNIDKDITKLCEQVANNLYEKTKLILSKNINTLKTLINELIEKETLEENQIKQILKFL